MPANEESRQRERTATGHGSRRLRIFVVEDEPDLRQLIGLALAQEGHEVVEMASGAALLDLLGSEINRTRARRADLVISDICMPGGSGLEVLTHLRRGRFSTPFIFITGFGDSSIHAAASELGALAILDKPFDLIELKAAVLKVPMPCV